VRLLHRAARTHARFDDQDLVSCAGLVPVMRLAERAGLPDLVAQHVRPPGPVGANADVKIGCLVAGMVAGADSIDDMDLLRHGAMRDLFGGVRAPSTLGSFLRGLSWGNVRQLEKVHRLVFDDGVPVVTTSMTLGEYLEQWVSVVLPTRVVAGDLAEGTAESYTTLARLHIIPALGRHPLRKLSTTHVRQWMTAKLTEPSAAGLAARERQEAARKEKEAVRLAERANRPARTGRKPGPPKRTIKPEPKAGSAALAAHRPVPAHHPTDGAERRYPGRVARAERRGAGEPAEAGRIAAPGADAGNLGPTGRMTGSCSPLPRAPQSTRAT